MGGEEKELQSGSECEKTPNLIESTFTTFLLLSVTVQLTKETSARPSVVQGISINLTSLFHSLKAALLLLLHNSQTDIVTYSPTTSLLLVPIYSLCFN